MVELDLNQLTDDGRVCNLSGRELGSRARRELGVDALERSHDTISVNVPEHVYLVSPSFFAGLFSDSMKRADSMPKFFEKFKFSCTPNISKQIYIAAQRAFKDMPRAS